MRVAALRVARDGRRGPGAPTSALAGQGGAGVARPRAGSRARLVHSMGGGGARQGPLARKEMRATGGTRDDGIGCVVACGRLRSPVLKCGHLVACAHRSSSAVTLDHLRSPSATCGHQRTPAATCGPTDIHM